MPTEIYLVKVGMTMTEGVVEEWYVPDGGRVGVGEMVYRLETEKVNLDVDAEAAGTVKHLVAPGVTLEPGDVVGYIYADDEAIPDVLPGAAGGAPALVDAAAPTPAEPAAGTSVGGARGDRAPSSPSARRLARELDVDLDGIVGTGPGGRIVDADVRAAASTQAAAPAAAAAKTVSTAARKTVPVKGIRRTIATRMMESLATSAQLTMDMDVVMDDAVRLRAQLIDEWAPEGIRPTYTDLVLRAVAKALRAHPRMNSEFRETEIVCLEELHLGIAVAVEEGLVVPVIRHADRLDLKELCREASRLAQAARAGTLGLDDMAGGTFTVSPLGMFGVDSFTPIINAPQAAIVGVNRIYDGVGWNGDVPVKRKTMRLSLTWDHRINDGVPAAQFLGAVRDVLEAPYRLLV